MYLRHVSAMISKAASAGAADPSRPASVRSRKGLTLSGWSSSPHELGSDGLCLCELELFQCISRCSVDTLECVVTAGHALWSIMAQLMDGRPLAIGQAAGFHSCGQVHRDLCRPASRQASRPRRVGRGSRGDT